MTAYEQDLRAERDKYKAQRDELLEALKSVLESYYDDSKTYKFRPNLMEFDLAHSAIAKVEADKT